MRWFFNYMGHSSMWHLLLHSALFSADLRSKPGSRAHRWRCTAMSGHVGPCRARRSRRVGKNCSAGGPSYAIQLIIDHMTNIVCWYISYQFICNIYQATGHYHMGVSYHYPVDLVWHTEYGKPSPMRVAVATKDRDMKTYHVVVADVEMECFSSWTSEATLGCFIMFLDVFCVVKKAFGQWQCQNLKMELL